MKLIRPAKPEYSKTGTQKSMAWFMCPACEKLILRQSNVGRGQKTCSCGIKRLPKPEIKKDIIPCLKCNKLFGSVNKIYNRFCPPCNRSNDSEYRKAHKHGKMDGKLHARKGN